MSSLDLTADLIRCESVTPNEGGALDLLERVLGASGFKTTRLVFSDQDTPDIDNLYARYGTDAPHLCFAGHVDVVPPGDEAQWQHGPFSGTVEDGMLYGRGAVDMKGGVACFGAAAMAFVKAQGDDFKGSISFLITGDEEGPAINGTRKMLEWMAQNNEVPDHCLLGEPTNPEQLGDMVKIGRRGSMNGILTVTGTQGHVAYPHFADNPLPPLIAMLDKLNSEQLDQGSANFQPSNLEITSVDVGNPTYNIIPSHAKAMFNIRYNDNHSGDSLKALITGRCQSIADQTGSAFELEYYNSGEWFLAEPGAFSDTIVKAIADVTGRTPELSTSGGTSDGRFIKDYCPVIEFGLVGQTMHKVDECVAVADLETLTEIYARVIDGYFSS